MFSFELQVEFSHKLRFAWVEGEHNYISYIFVMIILLTWAEKSKQWYIRHESRMGSKLIKEM